MDSIRAVCVYGGSSSGTDRRFAEAASALGAALARAGLTVVYGGGRVGLMGAVADGALGAGGAVVGVIPAGLFRREVAHRGVTELIEVGSMHDRKLLMAERSDAFVALPGGYGTLEELAEIVTWAQLGVHAKPIVVLDVLGYWEPLFAFVDGAVRAGFMRPANAALLGRVDRVEAVLPALAAYDVPHVEKWITPDET